MKTKNKQLKIKQVTLLIAGIFSGSAYAQTEAPTEVTVVVTGLRAGIERNLDDKRKAVNGLEVISSTDIGKFPDTNLSESLQRIPGVTIIRSETGEGKQVNIRGLGPDFSRSEVNGGGGLNSFDFSVLPSELFSKVEVEKSPTAKSIEGGLAGTIRSETAKPFDSEGLSVVGSVGATAGEYGGVRPRMFFQVSNNWDDQFGLAISAASSKTHLRSSQVSFGTWAPFRAVANAAALASAPAALLDAATPRTTAFYNYEEERKNLGLAGTFQARIGKQVDLTLDVIHAKVDGARTDNRPDAPLEGDVSLPVNYTIANGAVTSATFAGIQNRIGTSFRPKEQKLDQQVLRLNVHPDDSWTVSPSLSHQVSEVNDTLNLYSFAINNADLSYVAGGDTPSFSSSKTNFSTRPEAYGFNALVFDRNKTRISDTAGAVDVVKKFFGSPIKAVNFGMRMTKSTSTSNGASSLLLNKPDNFQKFAISSPFHFSGAPANVPASILAVDVSKGKAAFASNTDGFQNGTDFLVTDHGETRNYTVEEKTSAAYLSSDITIDKLDLNLGLRVVRTSTDASGNQLVGTVLSPVSASHSYTDFLPALNTRYTLFQDAYLRSSYSRSLNRPKLGDLSPSQTIDNGALTGVRGNPKLDPYRADQFDLGFEYYWRKGAMFQATYFTKQIGSLISQASVTEIATYPKQLTGLPFTGPISFTQPVNGNSAKVNGIEFGLTSPFYFGPEFLRKFGAVLNYTYANSNASVTSSTGKTTVTALPGLSKNSVNAAIYYDKGGLDSRLAYTWRDDYLRNDATGVQFGGMRFIKAYGQFDYSLNIPVTKNIKIGIDLLNILDTKTKEYSLLSNGNKMTSNITDKERTLLLSLRGNL